MIDLENTLKPGAAESERSRLRLLTSRAIIGELLPDLNSLNDTAKNLIRTTCTGALDEWWKSSSLPELEAYACGCLNLLVEASKYVPDIAEPELTADSPCALLPLLTASREGVAALCAEILGPEAHSPDGTNGTADSRVASWKPAMEKWGKILGGKNEQNISLSRTKPGQLLTMHLLEGVLPHYEGTKDPGQRATLNMLLVPLMRSVFRHATMADRVYHEYHSFPATTNTSFHALYGHELGVLADFQSVDLAKRSELLALTRQHANDLDTLPVQLVDRANTILHGASAIDDVSYPRPKMVRLSQASCLIRSINTDAGTRMSSGYREYTPYLRALHYRHPSEDVGGHMLCHSKWAHDDRHTTFVDAVAKRYTTGHDIAFLKQLFGCERDGIRLPVWIHDGEITFMWLLVALKCRGSTGEQVMWVANHDNLTDTAIPNLLVTGDANDKATLLKTEPTLFTFLRTSGICSRENGTPKPRFWALCNFLQRLLVRREPTFTADTVDAFRTLAQHLYTAILANPQSPCNGLQVGLNAIIKEELWIKIADAAEILSRSRLPTFLLECILRQERDYPCSLFFYPIAFDPSPSGILPTAFVAGTFVGLECPHYPSVTDRHNYHLFACLDALRPIIDFEVGRVLHLERQNTEAARIQEREDTIRVIKPAVDRMSALFKDAANLAFTIDAAVDQDWCGLFSEASVSVISPIFDTRRGNLSWNGKAPAGELSALNPFHDFSTVTSDTMCAVLLYLLRCVQDSGRQEVPFADAWSTYEPAVHRPPAITDISEMSTHMVFTNRFFHALAQTASGISVHASPNPHGPLFALLKLLTVDCMDSPRGVFLAQVAAALSSATSVPGKVFLAGTPVAEGTTSLSPLVSLHQLATIILQDPFHKAGSTLKSTTQLHAKGRLPGNVNSAQFLRSLRILVGTAIGSTLPDPNVAIASWEASFASGTGIVIRLRCKHSFPSEVCDRLWKYVTGNTDPGFHDLRSSIRDISHALRATPVFLDNAASTDLDSWKPDESAGGFAVAQNGSHCHIVLRIPCAK